MAIDIISPKRGLTQWTRLREIYSFEVLFFQWIHQSHKILKGRTTQTKTLSAYQKYSPTIHTVVHPMLIQTKGGEHIFLGGPLLQIYVLWIKNYINGSTWGRATPFPKKGENLQNISNNRSSEKEAVRRPPRGQAGSSLPELVCWHRGSCNDPGQGGSLTLANSYLDEDYEPGESSGHKLPNEYTVSFRTSVSVLVDLLPGM